LREEVKNEFFDINEIITLFKDLFEVLVEETTALACVEVDNLCTEIHIQEEIYYKLPERLQDIIFHCLTLHD